MDAFLSLLYGEVVGEDRRLAIFTLPDRRTRLFSSVNAAALYAGDRSKTQDVYLCVGLAGVGCKGKSSASDVVAIPGFWADIDLPAPWRASKPLPPTAEDARSILDALPFQPSIVVDSGHGFQAWWLFKEPWVFDANAERLEAAKRAKGWVDLIRAKARERGWEVDPVGDLARVLRLPGTWNRKGSPPVSVRMIEHIEERRYNPDDFAPFAADEVSLTDEPTVMGDVVLHPDAEPPADKFTALMQFCPTFAQTWNRQRSDLSDQSQSAYDLSLADIAALNGWSDQEIASLLIAARRKHGENPDKALRTDYVSRTLSHARRLAEERAASGVDLSRLVVGDSATSPPPKTLRQLVQTYPSLRPPVIEGLLRRGETMNVISASKIGKSWLVVDLALSVATGRPWLGMGCVAGDVLIVDNELHCETSANRIPKVAEARGIPFEDVADRILVDNLRGRLQNLFALGPYFRRFAPGQFKMVILDAFYRFMPENKDENDNGTMANLYNYVDAYADYLDCSFVLIHHTSKGNQSQKELTDVGAGAGAQSRATDTHVILRRHEEDDAVVLEAAVRSWPPVPPRCLRWAFPVWMPADDLDPMALRQEKRRSAKADPGDAEPDEPAWTVGSFVQAFLTTEPKSPDTVLVEANERGLSDYAAAKLVRKAKALGLIHPWDLGRNRVAYATVPQPTSENTEEDPDVSKRAAVETMLRDSPDLATRDVADQCGVSTRYVQRIRRELGANKGGELNG